MVHLPDLLYVALFAVAWPVIDYLVLWPAFLRRARLDPDRARWRVWATTIVQQWMLVAVGVALFVGQHRPFAMLGLRAPAGGRLWGSVLLLVAIATYYGFAASRVARNTSARARLVKQLGELALLLPRSERQLSGFAALSLTAGFCEEFLFRGYLIWALTPALGWGSQRCSRRRSSAWPTRTRAGPGSCARAWVASSSCSCCESLARSTPRSRCTS
ncbi:MAG TPA: hypothetical protein VH109_10190 [Steroidobacteraceae bacterium]|nr:hypothetical protein [Steroidobacteraceae bacterium]